MGFNKVDFELETSDVVGFTPAQRTAVELQLVISISDRGSQLYENFKFPRYENFYGYAQLMSGAFVIKSIPLQYLNQEILHFRDETTGINETTGCYAKGIAGALNPPFLLITNTQLVRQRFTSVRFRLRPTVTANVTLTWEVFEPKCGGNILPPSDLQGQPPAPNNGEAAPGSRPPGQGGDNADPSANDGGYDPADGLPPPPTDTGSTRPIAGQWYAVYSGYNPGCQGTYSNRRYALLGATNGRIRPIYTRTQQGSCGADSENGIATYNGGTVDTPADVTSYSFEFINSGLE